MTDFGLCFPIHKEKNTRLYFLKFVTKNPSKTHTPLLFFLLLPSPLLQFANLSVSLFFPLSIVVCHHYHHHHTTVCCPQGSIFHNHDRKWQSVLMRHPSLVATPSSTIMMMILLKGELLTRVQTYRLYLVVPVAAAVVAASNCLQWKQDQ